MRTGNCMTAATTFRIHRSPASQTFGAGWLTIIGRANSLERKPAGLSQGMRRCRTIIRDDGALDAIHLAQHGTTPCTKMTGFDLHLQPRSIVHRAR